MSQHVRRVRSPEVDSTQESLAADIAALCTRASELGLVAPVEVERLLGGQSNLTYRVIDDAGRRVVVRRGPFGQGAAHDPLREARLLESLHDASIPTPRVLGMSDDHAAIGAPYFVMEHVDGATIRDRESLESLTLTVRRSVASELARTLAAVHAIDLRGSGLEDLRRPGAYVHRQLDRWERELTSAPDREGDQARSLVPRLRARAPRQRRTGLVHGDFRLDNVLVDGAGKITAVLDWELATIGDADADAGQFLAYWHDDPDTLGALEDPPSLAAGLPSRSELAAEYGAARGEHIPDVGFHVAFGLWKIAVLQLSVRRRYASGAYAGLEFTVPSPERVASLLEQAEEHLVA